MLANIPQQYGVFRALPLFMAGMLASRFSSILVGQAKASALLLFGSFGAVGLILLLPAREETSFLGLVAMLGIVAAAAGSDLRFPRWVATGAKLSFALYLVHELTSAVWFSMLGRLEATAHPGAFAYIGFALAFVLAVAAAWVLDKFVDGPIQRYLRHNPPKMLAEKLFQMRTKLI
jgi:peptidoglycan/LPS O-acetylase OafA/YrhL